MNYRYLCTFWNTPKEIHRNDRKTTRDLRQGIIKNESFIILTFLDFSHADCGSA